MSNESAAPTGDVALSLVARPGIAIKLLDGMLDEVASGTGRVERQCAPGLYLVEWRSAGRRSETMVRLDASRPEVTVEFAPSEPGAEASLDPAVDARVEIASEIELALSAHELGRGASVITVASAQPVGLDPSRAEVRLMGPGDRPVEPDDDERVYLQLATTKSVGVHRVRPGRHYVAFRAVTGELLGMAVPAISGRRTLVFLTLTRTRLLVADGERFDTPESVGVDPTRTVVVTTSGEEDDARIRERVRVAGLLLYDLANGCTSLTADLVSELDDDRADPLLRMYGALVVLDRIERGLSPDPGASDEAASDTRERRAWLKRASRWIPDPVVAGYPTDGSAAWWEIRRAFSKNAQGEAPRVLSHLDFPPMLECAWRWAIEESVERPGAVRGTAKLAATGRTAGATAPWLCWRLSAAKARPDAPARPTDDLSGLVQIVAERALALGAGAEGEGGLATALSGVSVDAQAAALKAVEMASSRTRLDDGATSDLAVALGLPGNQLRRRLKRTAAELAAPSSQPRPELFDPRAARPARAEAPGLSRRITHPDDPQKGRFGGRASRQGFTLSAHFPETKSRNWADIQLVVKGPGAKDEEVQFHLHDSFKPQMEMERFRRGQAKLDVTAWGGFTLGVWLPARSLELELDLAQLEDAPRIVRER